MKFGDKLLILVIALLLLGAYVRGTKYTPTAQLAKSLTVSGEGKATATPDTLSINLGITETGATTQDAQTAMEKKVTAFKGLLKEMNFPENKIQTENLNVYEDYDWTQSGRQSKGYRANQNITLELTGSDIAKRGSEIISQIPALGNIIVNSTNFFVKDPQAGVQAAREKAFENAKIKAEQLAKLSGQKVGKVLSIQDGSSDQNSYPTPYYRATNYAMDSAGAEAKTISTDTLSAGENTVTHYMTVVFGLE